jgi:hypothetical protein
LAGRSADQWSIDDLADEILFDLTDSPLSYTPRKYAVLDEGTRRLASRPTDDRLLVREAPLSKS